MKISDTVANVDNSKHPLRFYQSTVTPKRTVYIFVRTGKSEAEVTNNKSAL